MINALPYGFEIVARSPQVVTRIGLKHYKAVFSSFCKTHGLEQTKDTLAASHGITSSYESKLRVSLSIVHVFGPDVVTDSELNDMIISGEPVNLRVRVQCRFVLPGADDGFPGGLQINKVILHEPETLEKFKSGLSDCATEISRYCDLLKAKAEKFATLASDLESFAKAVGG